MKKSKKLLFLLCPALLICGCGGNNGVKMPVANTFKIEAEDTPKTILLKAAHTVPTENQLKALENEFIAFIHFGPNTFTRNEWGNGFENPSVFNLKDLDTDQWCQSMKDAGMKMVLLTVKHHDGFVLWQSRYTTHGIMSTPFQEGKGDILKELSESCKKYDLKLGIYMSPADLYQIEHIDGLYGNLSEKRVRTIPRAIEGRPFANKTTFEFEVDDYNEYFLNQLFEVLTEYGDIDEVWFDGAHPKRKGGQTYNYLAWKELIHTLAPKAVIFGREDIRWCGNEAGGTRNTEWNVIAYTQDPDTATVFPDMTDFDLGSRAALTNPETKYIHYQQAETNTSIREGWFYRDDISQKVRNADDVFDIYERSVGGNSTFLLNIPPNREGKFSQTDVDVLKEVGQRIQNTYGNNLLAGAKGPKALLDNNINTYLLLNQGESEIIITTPSPIKLNRIMLQEAIATHSERIEQHAVDVWVNNAWVEIAQATNVGYKRILRFPEVTTNKIRIRVLESRFEPTLATVAAYYYEPMPPQLALQRTMDGMVTIDSKKQDFGWNLHNQTSEADLFGEFKIYYTTDGTTPTTDSKEYTAPFKMDSGIVKAIAISNDKKGALLEEQLGFIKSEWKLLSASGENIKAPAKAAFDEDASTFWYTENKGGQEYIAIDLGKVQQLNGFAYTPPKYYVKFMLAKGLLQVSTNGKIWTTVQDFYFGNLINDPTKRYLYLEKPVEARYVKIVVKESADLGKRVSVGELDFF